MSFNTFGKIFRFTTWGESHGPAIGCIVDGCPPNIAISEKDIMVDFCEAPINDRSKLFPYFTDKRLRELTENIGEF